MTVRARFVIHSVNDFGNHQVVKAGAVYSADPADPNYSFSQATPDAHLSMTITNPDAFGFFQAEHVYDIDFTEVVAQADDDTDASTNDGAGQADPAPAVSDQVTADPDPAPVPAAADPTPAPATADPAPAPQSAS